MAYCVRVIQNLNITQKPQNLFYIFSMIHSIERKPIFYLLFKLVVKPKKFLEKQVSLQKNKKKIKKIKQKLKGGLFT